MVGSQGCTTEHSGQRLADAGSGTRSANHAGPLPFPEPVTVSDGLHLTGQVPKSVGSENPMPNWNSRGGWL